MVTWNSTLISSPSPTRLPAMKVARPQKRRKLTLSSLLTPNAQVQQLPKTVAATTIPPRCISCHRALNTMQNLLIICARCHSSTCVICSRTCTASPTSLPPTPYLTRSPTPSVTPSQSPRRSALTLHSTNTNFIDIQRGNFVVNAGKRKKAPDDNYDSTDAWEQVLGEFDLTQGCGRMVCRNCCTENLESESTTCHDCLDR